jgi:hypothetical protein
MHPKTGTGFTGETSELRLESLFPAVCAEKQPPTPLPFFSIPRNNFFKDRHWTDREFLELVDAAEAGGVGFPLFSDGCARMANLSPLASTSIVNAHDSGPRLENLAQTCMNGGHIQIVFELGCGVGLALPLCILGRVAFDGNRKIVFIFA